MTILIRFLDVTLALLGLLLLSPLLVLVFLACWLDTGSPIFLQHRLGKNKKSFVLFKFRTMRIDAPQMPTHLVASSYVSATGIFLRKHKLDELPQLFNVLFGDMSLVGPRPGLPNDLVLTKLRDSYKVYRAAPGITGAAQLEGVDMSQPEKLAAIDAKMLEEMNLKIYFILIYRTIF